MEVKKNQIKDNFFCRGECEKKNGTEEGFLSYLIFFLQTLKLKDRRQILSLTKMIGECRNVYF